MAAWHDAHRMQFERVHLQSSLLDDPPVVIPAFKSAVLATVPLDAGGDTPFGCDQRATDGSSIIDGDRRSACPGSATAAIQDGA